MLRQTICQHQGKRRGWESPEPVAAFPCWAPLVGGALGLNPHQCHMNKKKSGPFSGQHITSISQRKNFPIFFITQRKSESKESFHGVSPFLVKKAISGSIGEVKSTKKLRSGDLLVEVGWLYEV
ncbi:hypothetical protein AVEN_114661-1 [Araneus ventricosus]|uniref:Uncharacterized protein n=1 Tax=Araneus ventricosus TaxID=182803 RepID=A0A4Y2NLV5_ARAVE|nr:hypothetical protein AVEN_114661-1 [Araneus ventricosus]